MFYIMYMAHSVDLNQDICTLRTHYIAPETKSLTSELFGWICQIPSIRLNNTSVVNKTEEENMKTYCSCKWEIYHSIHV